MLESLEKLRYWLDYKVNRFNPGKGTIVLNTGAHPDELYVIADEIQAEIDANYMELPKDADGVPIRVGDEVCGYGYPNGGVVVKSLNGHMIIVGRLEGGENYAKSGLLWSAKDTRHVKPRTVEDVIAEYEEVAKSADVIAYNGLHDELYKLMCEEFSDKPERELYKELEGYEFYIELPYDELRVSFDKAWVTHHDYSWMYENPNGGSTNACLSLCGYSREDIVSKLDAKIREVEDELRMRDES